jgi:hypothetical protein
MQQSSGFSHKRNYNRIDLIGTWRATVLIRAESSRHHWLYLDPPQHAAVFCIDEKTAIQALDRLDPRLSLSPGAPSGTDLNITGTARYRCMAGCENRQTMAKPYLAIAAPISLPS